jgi:hypothetical protein
MKLAIFRASIVWAGLIVVSNAAGAVAAPTGNFLRTWLAGDWPIAPQPALTADSTTKPPIAAPPATNLRADAVVLAPQTLSFPRGGPNRADLPKSLQTAKITYPQVQGIGGQGLGSAELLKTLQTTISLKQLLGQSATELQTEAQEYSWMTAINYRVNYNQNFLLDLTLTEEGMGAYPDAFERHVVVDLRSGRSLHAGDVFDRASMKTLVALVNKAMEAEKQAKIAEVTSADRGENAALGIVQQLQEHTFRLKHLNDFMVDDRGVTFRYEYGFPHVIKAAQPEGRYFFSYADLKPFIRPDGALAQFVQASSVAPSAEKS